MELRLLLRTTALVPMRSAILAILTRLTDGHGTNAVA